MIFRGLLGVVLLCTGILTPGMTQNDFGLWTAINGRVSVTKNIKIGAQIQVRLEENVSTRSETFFSPYVSYQVSKHLQFSLDYRSTNNWDEGTVSKNKHRVTIDCRLEKILDLVDNKSRFKISSRLRFVQETQKGDLNDQYARGRLKLSYNLPKTKIEPHVAVEVFYHFNDQLAYTITGVSARHRISKYRVRMGFGIPLSKQHQIKCFYLIQQQVHGSKTDFIAGVSYRFSWKI